MALLFVVHVPYKPHEDEPYDGCSKNLFNEASKCRNQPSEVKDEVNCENEKSPEVSTDVTEKQGDDEPAASTDTESVEKAKQTGDNVSESNSITKSDTESIKPGSAEVKSEEQVEPGDAGEESKATLSDAETEVIDDSKSVDEVVDKTESKTDAEDMKLTGETDAMSKDNNLMDAPLTPLIQKVPIHKEVEMELDKLGVSNIDIHFVDDSNSLKFSFVEEDSQKSELILNRLRKICAGQTGANISMFPASLHENFGDDFDGLSKGTENDTLKKNPSDEVAQKESVFRKSVKSRLLVAQVVKSVTDNACFTFDYLLLLVLASLISCIGLAENSSVVLVASMLISPLMGPILAATFGQVIHKYDLRNLGLKSEMKGLAICLIIGFAFGLISGGVGLHGAVWGSTDAWPTSEMRSRGMLRSLWVGVLIALPSGAGVAISVLGGNAGSLVGVAISASLLPPACNAGMLWAYALLAAIKPPATVTITTQTPVTTTTMSTILANETLANITLPNTTVSYNTTVLSSSTSLPLTTTTATSATSLMCPPLYNNAYEPVYFCNAAHEAVLLGLVSLSLTLLNICCIMVMGVIVLKVKEVSPQTAASGVDNFWKEDVQVARTYYTTARGEASKSLGKMFLDEYKKIQAEKQKSKEMEDADTDEDMTYELATIELRHIIYDVENSPDCQSVISKLLNRPPKGVTEELESEYNEAKQNLIDKLGKQQTHHTFHHAPKSARPRISDIKEAFQSRKALSMVIDPALLEQLKPYSEWDESSRLEVLNENEEFEMKPKNTKRSFNLSNPKNSKLMKRRSPKVKFQVTKVEEEENLV